jgi:hypothetical protein
MQQLYSYAGFGIHIHSAIALPELLEQHTDSPDLTIRLSSIPDSCIPGPLLDAPVAAFTPEEYLLFLPGVAKYRVQQGKTIDVEPLDAEDIASLRLFLLSMVIPAALKQQGRILIHTSAVLVNGKLHFFIGQSKAGKSSIAAALKQRGYRVFSDDVCVLHLPDPQGEVLAFASYPMMKLWEETVDLLGDTQYRKEHRIRPHLGKFGQFFHGEFDTEAYPVSQVFVLHPHEEEAGDVYSHRVLGGLEAFEKISRHTYRGHFVQSDEQKKVHLDLMSRLVRQARIIEVHRQKNKSTIDGLADYMVRLL